MSQKQGLYIGYAHLEELIDAAAYAERAEMGPLYGAQCLTLLATISRPNWPIIRIEARVQFVTVSGAVHYWQTGLCERFDPPTDEGERSIAKNAELAWAVILAALAAAGLKPITGTVAFDKGIATLSGEFAGLRWNKTDLWHPAQADAHAA